MGDKSKNETIDVKLEEAVCDRSALKVRVAFKSEQLKADEAVELVCYLKNNSPKSEVTEKACSLPVKSIELIRKYADGNDQKTVSGDLKWSGAISLLPGQTHSQKFQLLPQSADVGKVIVIDQVIVTLGIPDAICIRLHCDLPKPQPVEANAFSFISIDNIKGKEMASFFSLHEMHFNLSIV